MERSPFIRGLKTLTYHRMFVALRTKEKVSNVSEQLTLEIFSFAFTANAKRETSSRCLF